VLEIDPGKLEELQAQQQPAKKRIGKAEIVRCLYPLQEQGV
jgi:hypothetical protein